MPAGTVSADVSTMAAAVASPPPYFPLLVPSHVLDDMQITDGDWPRSRQLLKASGHGYQYFDLRHQTELHAIAPHEDLPANVPRPQHADLREHETPPGSHDTRSPGDTQCAFIIHAGTHRESMTTRL